MQNLKLPSKLWILPHNSRESIFLFFLLETEPGKFNEAFIHLLRRSGACTSVSEVKKIVVVPTQLRSFWMHGSMTLEDGATDERVPTNHSVIAHLANFFVRRLYFYSLILRLFFENTNLNLI